MSARLDVKRKSYAVLELPDYCLQYQHMKTKTAENNEI